MKYSNSFLYYNVIILKQNIMNTINPFKVINKFFYFSFNYNVVYHEWKTGWGDSHSGYIPEFLTKVQWGCNEGHMIEKWLSISSNQYGQMFEFYAGLDERNREAIVNWIMENYHGA